MTDRKDTASTRHEHAQRETPPVKIPASGTQDASSEESIMTQALGECCSGSIPDAVTLKQYKEIDSYFPERIIRMAESQATHRQKMEQRIVYLDTLNSTLGMCFAFVIVMFAIGGGIYLINNGKNTLGLTSIISVIGGAALVFIGGRVYAIFKAREESKKAAAR